MMRKDIEQLLVGRLLGFETKREEQWYKLGLKEGLERQTMSLHLPG